MTPSFDPKLRECMVEIEKLMKKYDCAGFISLNSPTHGEFQSFLTHMTWSNIRFIPHSKGEAAHVKIHMKSSPQKTEATVFAIFAIRDMAALCFQQMDQIAKQIGSAVEINHPPPNITNEGRDDEH